MRVFGLLDISLWLLAALLLLGAVTTAVWYVPFQLLPTWNCIIMRNQEVVEQPMTVETLPRRLLAEAQDFIRRWENGGFRCCNTGNMAMMFEIWQLQPIFYRRVQSVKFFVVQGFSH